MFKNLSEGGNNECTVCLSEFKPDDQLRFLPCCHVFHTEYMDS
ncbi:hypothetical protein ACJIZ3_008280 [Penstemon smallii]|uniref:RING-type domain-containing protein n=1 Tax=Penstemon smallii TaxID=265156 RepID=A0ABD3T9A5_9LAMI